MTPTHPDGYLALPPVSAGKSVLVLHPWWGLNDTVRGVCDRLAESGFLAFAPDLYHGVVTTSIPEAERLSGALFKDLDLPRQQVADAAAFLHARLGQPAHGLAVIGFSLGAFFALDLSLTLPDVIRSVVIFYGTRPGDYTGARAAYLGHFAESDPFEPREGVDELLASLQQAGRPATFHHYAGTGHWFFEPDRVQAYRPVAAGLAWDRTLAFLRGNAPPAL